MGGLPKGRPSSAGASRRHPPDPGPAPAPTPPLLISPCLRLPLCLYTLSPLEDSPRLPEQEVPRNLHPPRDWQCRGIHTPTPLPLIGITLRCPQSFPRDWGKAPSLCSVAWCHALAWFLFLCFAFSLPHSSAVLFSLESFLVNPFYKIFAQSASGEHRPWPIEVRCLGGVCGATGLRELWCAAQESPGALRTADTCLKLVRHRLALNCSFNPTCRLASSPAPSLFAHSILCCQFALRAPRLLPQKPFFHHRSPIPLWPGTSLQAPLLP